MGQDFETVLHEVVQAKRLSQSKMTKLTETAMRLMDQDTQLVSAMYRTHKLLPTSCKISSLYVFDALARAARQQVTKHNLSERQGAGNCATFLSKVAGVLEGLFQDMLAAGLPEAKDKTKKIYDIWVKGNTFPPDILSRLSDILSGKDKDPRVNTTNLRVPPQTDPPAPTQDSAALPHSDSQATLLALLTQAAGQQIPQTTANTVASSTTPADPTQLLLHYLQSASVNSTAANQISTTTSLTVSDAPVSQTATDPRISKPSIASHAEAVHGRQSPRHDNYRSPPREDRYHERGYDNRAYPRNDQRNYFRRRERWNRWDERELNHQRESNRDGRNSRRVPSRSRSPDGPARRRRSPAFSPPRHQPLSPRAQYTGDSPTSRTTGKDEFGRDLRSPSPSKSPISTHSTIPSATTSPITPSTHEPKAELSTTSTSNDPMSRSSSIAANTFSKDPHASNASVESSASTTSQTAQDSFDMTTFDPTSPASWEALGKMWEAMNGYTPSTEELMQFMMMGAMSNTTISNNWQQCTNGINGYGGECDTGSPRGRGGFYGNSRDNQYGRSNGGGQATDAVVLGGGEMDSEVSGPEEADKQEQSNMSGGRPAGKMQKVGDRWVFVRDGTTP
ncbi:Rpb7-binding protein seb1 [Leucoagaricus sp. SymC.cos]|nr:Rpb7-binding protein seb1 [Leucoagaricus sp. SymC.cos]